MRGRTEKIKDQPYTSCLCETNEMTPISDNRPMGTNRFGLQLVLLRSTYGQKMAPKRLEHLGMFPRQTFCMKHILKGSIGRRLIFVVTNKHRLAI